MITTSAQQTLGTPATSLPTTEKLMLCSFPKSGTYLFWRILRALQKQAGSYRSFARAAGLTDLLDEMIEPENRPYAHYSEMDQLYPSGDDWLFYVHHPMQNLTVDLDMLLQTSSLIWLHEAPTKIQKLSEGRKQLYMMRDGRSVVNSLIHHFTRPSVRATHPTYKIDDPLVLYQRKDNFRKYVQIWRDHVQDFLSNSDDYFLLRFEDLTSQMPAQVERLLQFLEIDGDAAAIAEEFSFDRMKSASPTHVRSGTNDDWRRYYEEEHIAIFKEEAGQLLIDLGYAQDLDW